MARRPRSNRNGNGWIEGIALHAWEQNLHERCVSVIGDIIKNNPDIEKELARQSIRVMEALLRAAKRKYPLE